VQPARDDMMGCEGPKRASPKAYGLCRAIDCSHWHQPPASSPCKVLSALLTGVPAVKSSCDSVTFCVGLRAFASCGTARRALYSGSVGVHF
jgi:hypothetical protein